jgi:GxxExxY protein
MGPGLLESAYEACLEMNCSNVGLRCERQKPLPVVHHGVRRDCGYRIDLLVEDVVLVELKAVSRALASTRRKG